MDSGKIPWTGSAVEENPSSGLRQRIQQATFTQGVIAATHHGGGGVGLILLMRQQHKLRCISAVRHRQVG